ncbi:hypothetical protein [Sphingomonas jaspsi]|uniref:hypothetical protein n=1 Tax=Sphingomonas jaspsi TaxID=392409 RepID=UPI0004B70096|nr:hypothetical protein [Sphingomonas jaspsi]
MSKLLGGILFAIGLLIAGASGLCSAAVFFAGVSNVSQIDFSVFPIVALFGGIPLAGGIGLMLLGRSLIRSSGASPPNDPPNP